MTREEAIKQIRIVLENLKSNLNGQALEKDTNEAFETHIPELKESEDERIRKEIIDIVTSYRSNCVYEGNHHFDECLSWLEKQKEQKPNFDTHWENGSMVCEQKEQKPIKMEVYEVGKGTTVCGQDYKCKKDYKAGNCRYIKDAIYHCGRDGYLTDQNGVSWSCTPEWFKEYIQSNTEWAEEEKTRFVSGQFLQCKLSFDEFKEGEHYWLEYVGDDMYVGRSDNILNQKFHITPRQLYTLFSQQLEEVQGPPQEERQVPLTYEPPFDENPSDKEIIEALIHHLNEQDGFLTAINCVSTKAILSWLKNQKEQKSLDYAEELKKCKEILSKLPDYTPTNLSPYIEQKPAEWDKLQEDFRNINEAFEDGKKEVVAHPEKYGLCDCVPAGWDEEDSDNLERVDNYLWMLDDYVGDDCAMPQGKTDNIRGNIRKVLSPWLKSLPERFNLQPKQEWSEKEKDKEKGE